MSDAAISLKENNEAPSFNVRMWCQCYPLSINQPKDYFMLIKV